MPRPSSLFVLLVTTTLTLPSKAFLLPSHHHYSPSNPPPFSSSQTRLFASSSSSTPNIQVTPELIKHTATLAQLQFDDEEVKQLVPRFQAFLSFVDKMQEVPDDAPGMTPGSLPSVDEVLRADQAAVFGNQDGIFANMAEQEDAYLVVPKVGEEDV